MHKTDYRVFREEYDDFVSMGLSEREIARAFGISPEALRARIKRSKLLHSL